MSTARKRVGEKERMGYFKSAAQKTWEKI